MCCLILAFVMTAQFDKCRVFNFAGEGKRCIREQLMSEDVAGKDKYASHMFPLKTFKAKMTV